MFDYHTLDFIADCYTPLLLLSLIAIFLATFTATPTASATAHRWSRLGIDVLLLCYGAVVTYALMFADKAYSLWPTIGLDYSTHTAAALILVLLIHRGAAVIRWPNGLLFLAYAGLMIYQKYHTTGDILSTAIVVALLFYPVVSLMDKKLRVIKV